MERSNLIIAEQIAYRNNKLTAINIWEQFTALSLPSKFNFDMAFICGPGWQPGEYNLVFKVKSRVVEPIELGNIKINIQNERTVFNAIASNLNFVIENNSGDISFIIERDGQVIMEREYPVKYLLETKPQQELVEA